MAAYVLLVAAGCVLLMLAAALRRRPAFMPPPHGRVSDAWLRENVYGRDGDKA